MSRSSSLHKTLFLPFAFSAILIISGCAEDTLSDGVADDMVKFNVSVNNGQATESFTRSEGEPKNSLRKSLTLRKEDSPLYLHPKTLQGIVTSDHVDKIPGRPAIGLTRSEMITTDNISSFGVYASVRPSESTPVSDLTPDYMSNVEVTRENNWAPGASYLWPGKGSLHLNAYSPYASSPSEYGITSLPAKSRSGNMSLDFKTPAEVADQFDLLVSSPVDASSSPCDIVFNHALTAVRFTVGSELVACTVKQISISGVNSEGSYDMEQHLWTSISNPQCFTVSPEIKLEAEDGSKYVAAGTEITSGDQTFILVPQTLSESSTLSISFEIGGEDVTLESSLENVLWEAGKTTVYRISANPNEDGYILEITDSDGNPISSLTSDYTGSTLDFKVKSAYGDASDSSSLRDIPWKAEFVDENGNVITRPDWISTWTMSGAGSADLSSVTQMQTPIFEAISEESTALRNATDINETSGYRPYNLSNSTGQASVQNTANCYLVHAPGFYSIPLVYGNAISGGAANTSAYLATSSSNTHILKNLVNHLGVGITDPYIYNNPNCQPEDAVLVWEGRLNLLQKVQLSPDKKRLIFVVSPDFICQGNAIVAVRDANGIIMWSWHIWVTPYEPDSDPITIAYHGKNYEMMTQNLGQISAGDRANFAQRNVKVRYTQVPTDGSDPLTVTLDITQTGKIVTTPDSYNYYQWGRKDPMISDVAEWYTADYNEVTKIWTRNFSTDRTPGLPIIADYIRTPGYFWINPAADESFPYYNLWNTNNSTTAEVKTVYDPSPVGYMVARNVLTALNNAASTPVTGKYGIGVNVTIPDTGETVFFPTHGYRARGSGNLEGINSGSEIGTVWSSRTTSTKEASALVIQVKATTAQLKGGESRGHAFGVRAAKEIQ